jgi:ferredoxin
LVVFAEPLAKAGRAREGEVKVVVDFDLCEANGLCMESAPEVFRLDDKDELHILVEHPPETLRKKVEDAVRRCPRMAIRIED